jgi:hypothetical protein
VAKPSTGFIDAAKAFHNPINAKCSMRAALEQMTPDLRAEVIAALRLPFDQLSAPAIAQALKARGIDVDEQAVRRHRARKCRCPDDLR